MFVLAIEQGMNVWLAIGLVVIAAMIVGAAFERFLIQPLESRSVLAPVILTLGLFFILNGGAATIWGTQPRTADPGTRSPAALDDKFDIITDRVPNFFITYKALGVWVTVAVLVIAAQPVAQADQARPRLPGGARPTPSRRSSSASR